MSPNEKSHKGTRCSNLLDCADKILEKLEELRKQVSSLQNRPEKHEDIVNNIVKTTQDIEKLAAMMREMHFYLERYMLQMKKAKWGAIYLAIYLFIYGVGNFLVLSGLWGKLVRTNPSQLEEVIVFALTWVLILGIGVVGLAYLLRVFSQMIDPRDASF